MLIEVTPQNHEEDAATIRRPNIGRCVSHLICFFSGPWVQSQVNSDARVELQMLKSA